MEVVSIKVHKRIKEKMKALSDIKWSEVIRQAIMKKIVEEEAKKRKLDLIALTEAAQLTDRVRRPSPRWSSVEEIRRWRDQKN